MFPITKSVYLVTARIPISMTRPNAISRLFFDLRESLRAFFSSFVIVSLCSSRYALFFWSNFPITRHTAQAVREVTVIKIRFCHPENQ